MEYPIDRLTMEVKRQLDVLDQGLAQDEYLADAKYSIADIATFTWYGGLVKGWQYSAAQFLSCTNMCICNVWQLPSTQLRRSNANE